MCLFRERKRRWEPSSYRCYDLSVFSLFLVIPFVSITTLGCNTQRELTTWVLDFSISEISNLYLCSLIQIPKHIPIQFCNDCWYLIIIRFVYLLDHIPTTMEIEWYNIGNAGQYHHWRLLNRYLFFIQFMHPLINLSFCYGKKNCHFESVGIWRMTLILSDLLIILSYQNMFTLILFSQSAYCKNTLILCDHIKH